MCIVYPIFSLLSSLPLPLLSIFPLLPPCFYSAFCSIGILLRSLSPPSTCHLNPVIWWVGNDNRRTSIKFNFNFIYLLSSHPFLIKHSPGSRFFLPSLHSQPIAGQRQVPRYSLYNILFHLFLTLLIVSFQFRIITIVLYSDFSLNLYILFLYYLS